MLAHMVNYQACAWTTRNVMDSIYEFVDYSVYCTYLESGHAGKTIKCYDEGS